MSVWTLLYRLCSAMEPEPDDGLAAFPADASVGGIAGERCPDSRESIDVNVASALAVFDDSEPSRQSLAGQPRQR